ncbi:MAG TPA: tetratricopeptide repeat protein [Candidatus Paceibacterota bacterium]|jgi:tetratricopeptide (TPR) repeat protein|nr:tetratricopeptide repeat protein [Candidatus Paceibacterota bacterium]
MNATTRNVLIGVIIVVIAILGYFAWKERQGTIASVAANNTATSSTSTGTSIDLSTLTGATTTGGYTITPITTGTTPTPPNYKKPLTFAASISADEKAQDQSQFAAVQTTLASDPKNYSAWLELGILRKATGDYAGAAADWKYVTELYPSDPTAFANLGDLYANYLHQNPQGIAYYKQAIKLDPTKEATFYENLAQIYVNEGDTADAKATLQQGINAQVIGYQNLQTQLNSMQ